MAVKRKTVAKIIDQPVIMPEMVAKRRNYKKWLWITGILLVVVGFWWKTNSWPIVAMVGWRPITRWEVNKQLYNQYGGSYVDNLVIDKLVSREIGKQKIDITDEEVETKVVEINTQLAASGTKLEDYLALRGQTVADFKKQLKVQMGVERVLDSRVTITDEEVETYIKENEAMLTSTGEARKVEATSALKYSRYTDELAKWIEELKGKVKIWQL